MYLHYLITFVLTLKQNPCAVLEPGLNQSCFYFKKLVLEMKGLTQTLGIDINLSEFENETFEISSLHVVPNNSSGPVIVSTETVTELSALGIKAIDSATKVPEYVATASNWVSEIARNGKNKNKKMHPWTSKSDKIKIQKPFGLGLLSTGKDIQTSKHSNIDES
jgi:hypothetical protein